MKGKRLTGHIISRASLDDARCNRSGDGVFAGCALASYICQTAGC
jgi:hypothetical protein